MSLNNLHGLLITKYHIDSKYTVNVTHINNPHDFYIRPVLYGIFMSTIEKPGEPIKVHKIQLHQIVIFKTQRSRKFARGRVASINGEAGELTFDIFARDYGFLEKSVLSENIYHPANEDIISVPPLALPCQLDLCYPIGGVFNDTAIKLSKIFLGNETGTARIKYIIGDKYIVQMKNTLGDIATHLFLMKCSSYVPSSTTVQTQRNIPEYQFKFKQLKVGDVLDVQVQSGNSLKGFYVVEKNDYEELINNRDELRNFYRYKTKVLPHEMKEGKAICAWVGYRFERALIKQITIPESKALVQLVDWGSILEVDVSKMKPASQVTIKRPVSAIYCSVGESNIYNNRLERFVHPGFKFTITIKQIGDNFNTPNIVDVSHMH